MSPRVGRGCVRVGSPSLHSMSTPSLGSPGWASGRDPTSSWWRCRELPAGLIFSPPWFMKHLGEPPGEPRGRVRKQSAWPCPAGEQGGPEGLGLNSKRLLFLTVA